MFIQIHYQIVYVKKLNIFHKIVIFEKSMNDFFFFSLFVIAIGIFAIERRRYIISARDGNQNPQEFDTYAQRSTTQK